MPAGTTSPVASTAPQSVIGQVFSPRVPVPPVEPSTLPAVPPPLLVVPPLGGAAGAAASTRSRAPQPAAPARRGRTRPLPSLTPALHRRSEGLLHRLLVLGLAVVGLLAGVVAAVSILALSGEVAACAERAIVPDPAASQELKSQWRAYGTQANAGAATVTFTELQATSRAVEYVEAKDVSVEDLQVYFCSEGFAEASGRLSIAGVKTRLVVRGTLDLSGDRPELQIEDVRAGNLPDAIARPVVNVFLDTRDLRRPDIDESIGSLTYTEGSVTVSSTP